MIADWYVPSSLVTSAGTLTFNQQIDGLEYALDATGGCKTSLPLRVTKDNIPQQNGSVSHRRFTEGAQVQLKINLLEDGDRACGDAITTMVDEIMRHLMVSLDPESAVFHFTPEGHDERIYSAMQWMGPVDIDLSGAYPSVTFVLDTPFPYAIGLAQTTPVLDGIITNNGNTNFYPVLHIDGPFTGFVVGNETALVGGILYDGSLGDGLGAVASGHYVEIDCFRNTITLDGDVRFDDQYLDATLSTYFYLLPGANTISFTVDGMGGGSQGYALNNDAWA